MTNINIKAMAISHPSNVVDNSFFIEHFKEVEGKDYTDFLENILGRKSRHITTDGETTVTMAIDACKKVLEKSKLTAADIDLILFTTQVPEYTLPTNSVIIHGALGCGHRTGAIDTNANCSGMTIALEQASQYLASHPHMERILVVGSDNLSRLSNPADVITYANFGDAAVAMILEKTTQEGGLIDSMFYTDPCIKDRVTYPVNGFTQAKKEGTVDYIQWLPFDAEMPMVNAQNMIIELLERNGLTTEDIKAYCFSQFSIVNINHLKEAFNLSQDKIAYIGDKFGYTGTTSPLLALYHAIEDGRVQRGDKVLLWTIGIGYQLIAVLYQY